MRYIAHESRLSAPTEDGAGARAHMEASARMGGTGAQYLNDEPPFPEHLRPLHDLSRALLGRSGVGMDGYAPLSPTVALDYIRGADICGVEPHEFSALFVLDAVWRHPPEPAAEGPKEIERPTWPSESEVIQ